MASQPPPGRSAVSRRGVCVRESAGRGVYVEDAVAGAEDVEVVAV